MRKRFKKGFIKHQDYETIHLTIRNRFIMSELHLLPIPSIPTFSQSSASRSSKELWGRQLRLLTRHAGARRRPVARRWRCGVNLRWRSTRFREVPPRPCVARAREGIMTEHTSSQTMYSRHAFGRASRRRRPARRRHRRRRQVPPMAKRSSSLRGGCEQHNIKHL